MTALQAELTQTVIHHCDIIAEELSRLGLPAVPTPNTLAGVFPRNVELAYPLNEVARLICFNPAVTVVTNGVGRKRSGWVIQSLQGSSYGAVQRVLYTSPDGIIYPLIEPESAPLIVAKWALAPLKNLVWESLGTKQRGKCRCCDVIVSNTARYIGPGRLCEGCWFSCGVDMEHLSLPCLWRKNS